VIVPGSFDAVLQAAVRAALLENEERLRTIIREEIGRAAQFVERSPSDDLYEMLVTADAAREAACSEKTIRRACTGGALAASKPMGVSEWRIKRGDLRKWMAGGRTTTATTARDPEKEGRRMAARLLASR
jgi:hypothetical protein